MGTRRYKPCIPRHWEATLPPRIEDYVGEEHWVRAIDAFVAALDLDALGLQHAGGALGRGQPAKSTADFTSHAGLGLVGMAIRQRTNLAAEAAAVSALRSDAMPHGDILTSYVALLCLGKSDFEAIDAFWADPYFLEALGLRQVPSAASLRQRLDANAPGFKDAVIGL